LSWSFLPTLMSKTIFLSSMARKKWPNLSGQSNLTLQERQQPEISCGIWKESTIGGTAVVRTTKMHLLTFSSNDKYY
jgi:hypothetical protein